MSKWIKRVTAVLPLAVAAPIVLAPAASAAQTCSSGPLNGGATKTVSVSADQVIWIKVSNHDFRGMLLSIRDKGRKKTLFKGVIAPGKSRTTKTDVFGERPIGYTIEFNVDSDASNNYTYQITSDRCY
ncbi:hypothetical protein ACFS2C_20405 [Prauserella oleivorans]|uniref:Uncharacterized protein n=1 Tax=Prauserella oleivorans TaxID=1478153 RepID=A0ABW5WF03_9PSEU